MSKTTINTDVLTIRKVLALSTNNQFIPALTCLTADGQGGTYWATPSSLGGIPAFNTICLNASNYVSAALPVNILSINTTNGIGISASNAGFTIQGQAFTQFEVAGTNSLVAFSNSTGKPTVRFIGGTGVQLASDPVNNWLTIQAEPSSIGGGIYTFNNFAAVENLLNPSQTTVVTTTGVNQTISTIGSNDILITAVPGFNQLFFGISSFTSQDYLTISTLANYGYTSSLSSVSTLFTDRTLFYQSTLDTVNFVSNVSVGIRTTFNNVYVTLGDKVDTSLFETFSNAYGGVTSTIKTGLASTFTFTSSLGVTDGLNLQAGPPLLNTLLVSTHTFNLSTMSSLLMRAGQTSLTFSPSFLLGPTNQGATFPLTQVSTFLYAGTSIMRTANFTRPWLVPNASGNSNLYTDTICWNFSPQELSNSYLSTYTICHRILNYKHSVDYGGAGFTTSTLSTMTSPMNALQVQITGKVFTS